VEQLTFGDAPAVARAGPARTGYEIERELAAAGSLRVAGVDEVGRGAWAGPVVVCAVIARAGFPAPPEGLTDSKRLTARRRAQLAAELPAWIECYAIGEASHEEIDALGMTAALRRAAVRALDGLAVPPPDVVLLDGSHDYIGRPWLVRCAVKADLRSVSVAAASVLAKVHRDNLMAELGRPHAEFAFEENAGYPSPAHQRALASLGPTPYHRLSWSYLDDLPEWRHLKKTRPDIEGQLSLLLRLGTVISVIPNERRRLFLRYTFASMAAVAVAGAAGVELISRGVLPGKGALDELDGACSVDGPGLAPYARPGPQLSGTFYSAARRRAVGYTIAYPPGHGPGGALPLVVMLHGYGDDHATALSGMSPAQAVALRVGGAPLPPMAMVTVDGGDGYWNPHPGDDPMGMLTGELIPLCQRRGLGRAPHRIGVMGISMGGFGALLLAEKRPDLVAAVAAISPAIWTSYDQARAANAGAYASADDFAADDAVTHAAALARMPVRVAAGRADPFYPGVQALARVLRKGAIADFTNGCHDGSFFTAQEPPSLAFLARHIAV